jgi:predicted transcriptional regulator
VSQNERVPLSDAELQVLKLLWSAGPSPAGRIRDLMADAGREWAYNTTKTLLDRLEEKGYVSRDRATMPHVFTPVVSPEGLASARLRKVGSDLFDDAGMPLVRALMRTVRLAPDEIAELRASLDRMEQERQEDRE